MIKAKLNENQERFRMDNPTLASNMCPFLKSLMVEDQMLQHCNFIWVFGTRGEWKFEWNCHVNFMKCVLNSI